MYRFHCTLYVHVRKAGNGITASEYGTCNRVSFICGVDDTLVEICRSCDGLLSRQW